jgi:L,D-peptidoglycan transpeptidase YkuD (ErfK/YbiS/YcfS/YnhG family)
MANLAPLAELVVSAAPGALVGMLTAGGASYPCTVGRGGVALKRGEGDGVTPVGRCVP